MACRAHRWKGDDTPLTGVHGGTANAARLAVLQAKERRRKAERELYERAHAVVREVIARNQALSDSARKDRLRPKAAARARPKALRSWLTDCMEKQKGRCAYCGCPMLTNPPTAEKDRRATIDHVVALALGGKNTRSNVVAACARCNQEKGCMEADEYHALWTHRRGQWACHAARAA